VLATAAAAAAAHDAARLLVLAAEDELRAEEVCGCAAGVAGERGVEISHASTLAASIAGREFFALRSSEHPRRGDDGNAFDNDAPALTDSHFAAFARE
jgi:hypothetical protein